MTTQWGAPLTGAQMKLLLAAGLADETAYQFRGVWTGQWQDGGRASQSEFLAKNHAAYTLAKAGWLDGRNVALWFGGEKAPDDWDGGPVLLADGTIGKGKNWKHEPEPIVHCFSPHPPEHFIIAYTRKAAPANDKLKEAVRLSREMTSQTDTVTIAKMTEAEANEWLQKGHCAAGGMNLLILDKLGLIREPTRLERFWSTRDTKDVYGPPCKAFQLIEEALNFEK